MFTVLVVYQEIPENTYVYKLEVDQEDLDRLRLCQGHYINATDMDLNEQEATQWLNEHLAANQDKIIFGDVKKDNANAQIDLQGVDHLIVTGFML